MIAIKRLQGFFWVLLVTLGALFVYLVSLQVGIERNALAKVERKILNAKGDLRYLETEFSARASMRQLEAWNAEDFRYSTPAAQQYLGGERALAQLDRIQPNGPVYIATPVMTAMAGTDFLPQAATPSPAAGAGAAGTLAAVSAAKPAAPAASSPAASDIRADFSVIRTAAAAERRADAVNPAPSNMKARAAARPDPVARKAARMAMLDDKLLDDGTLSDLSRSAAAERRRR